MIETGQLHAQALALKNTAESLIKAGSGAATVDASTAAIARALIDSARSIYPSNPIVMALAITPTLNYAQILAISNTIYSTP
jgi:hypothetical protein